MRILTALIAATLLTLSIAGCGSDDDDDSATTPAPGSTEPAGTPGAGFTPVITPQAVAPDVASTVALDADASTEPVDAEATHAVGAPFTVAFLVTEAGGPYQGVQMDFEFDPAVITFDSVNHLRPSGLETCSPTQTFDGNRFASFCLETELNPVTYTGRISEITFDCAAAGTTELHMRTPEDGSIGTKVQTEQPDTSYLHTLTTQNATVTCE